MQDDSQATELPRAYVVAKKPVGNERNLSAEEVKQFVKENLSNHKQLQGGVVFVDEIPKSASGKILRKEIRLMAKQEMRMAKL